MPVFVAEYKFILSLVRVSSQTYNNNSISCVTFTLNARACFFCFLICKMGIITVSTVWGLVRLKYAPVYRMLRMVPGMDTATQHLL
jgi:hypothetical protein